MDVDGWIPYDKRSEWSDLTPIFQTDEEKSVVNIAYSEKLALVYAYFRSIIQAEEKSDRALELTKDAALLNPANYTVWKFRRDLISHLNKDVDQEIIFCHSVIEENPKNYQVWHHLKLLVEISGNCGEELQFTDLMLRDDSKNYHAWQHRQWVVKIYRLWSNELSYSEELLIDDIHNNSAWNYRYYVISNTSGFLSEVLDSESELTEKCNDVQKRKIWAFCEELYLKKCRASHLLSFMLFGIEQMIAASNHHGTAALKMRAKELLRELREIDPVRRNYWEFLDARFF
uniref:Protein farnesyltransferase/geranylgeranyltransferase type-1 subunit alpha n=1 Tax=Romanomermis culicivorax TaxID=13658 RepID=A0A915L141_ROMCU